MELRATHGRTSTHVRCRAVVSAAVITAALTAQVADARVPDGNLTKNPTFASNTHGWSGLASKVVRERNKRAPDGRTVAKVSALGSPTAYSIDDAPATVTRRMTEARATYTGTAYVRGGRRTVGRRVGLVVRETTASGDWVADSESVVRLPRRKFRKVETSLIASVTGNVIDVYVYRSGSIRPGESFMTDAISLAVEPPAEEPPVEEPPAEEPPAEEPPVPSSPLTTSQVALITSHEDPLFEEDGSKYAYIMIRDSLHYRLEELRQVHPEAKILLYKNVAFTLVDPGCRWAPFQGGGVHYCEADTHENWFLHHKTTGERLVSSGYASQRAMDIGNPNYRQAWISSVLDRVTDAQADGSNARYDGVWMDDSNLYPGHGMDGQIAGMTDTQYRQRMVEFIEMAASELEQAGVLSVLNLGMNPWEADQRAAAIDVAGDVSMINREGLVRWGEGTTWTDPDGDAPFWDDEIALAEDIQAAGAKFHAMTYGTSNDVQIQRYARATFLMAWDGTEGSAFNFRTSDGGEWTSEWTTDVGRPTEARRRVGQGWRRDFTGGTVVINTRGSGSQTFNLGASYELPGGNCTTSVTLAATRAMVLPSC